MLYATGVGKKDLGGVGTDFRVIDTTQNLKDFDRSYLLGVARNKVLAGLIF